jgi:hypothetical protein
MFPDLPLIRPKTPLPFLDDEDLPCHSRRRRRQRLWMMDLLGLDNGGRPSGRRQLTSPAPTKIRSLGEVGADYAPPADYAPSAVAGNGGVNKEAIDRWVT